MDTLTAERIVIIGGPLDERRALLVMQHDSERVLRTRLDEDPWVDGVLMIDRIEPWRLWLAPRAANA
jgi:hypothetical protein